MPDGSISGNCFLPAQFYPSDRLAQTGLALPGADSQLDFKIFNDLTPAVNLKWPGSITPACTGPTPTSCKSQMHYSGNCGHDIYLRKDGAQA